MASYYYLISSLPDLRTDGDMPFTYEEFLGMCQSNVSESKYEFLSNLTPVSYTHLDVYKRQIISRKRPISCQACLDSGIISIAI